MRAYVPPQSHQLAPEQQALPSASDSQDGSPDEAVPPPTPEGLSEQARARFAEKRLNVQPVAGDTSDLDRDTLDPANLHL
eukprot:15464094-Alexandrium_andersonii.AAC.1